MTFIGVGEWLARREQLTPEKIALIDAESQQRFSYRTLNLRACALAALFREQFALQKGERVAILARNAPEYLDAFFACALLGAMLVPLNTRLTVHELTGILRDCEPKLLLYDDVHAAPVAEIVAMLNAGRQDPLQARPRTLPYSAFPGASVELARRAIPFQTSDGEEPVLILYTSGTTGSPKGALLSHRMLIWNAVNTQVSWGLRDTDATPTFAPFFHAGGLNVLTTGS